MISTFSKPIRLQIFGDHVGCLQNVSLMFFGRADAGNAEQVLKFFKKALLIFACVGNVLLMP